MIICKRIADGTLWTPACDSPLPLNGFNFVRAYRKHFLCFSWWAKDIRGVRWIFKDGAGFDVVVKK